MLELGLLALVGGLLRISPALAWAVVGDCLTQRCGRFNLGLEGIIPCGAVAALALAHTSGSAWLGLAGAAAAGGILALAFSLCCSLPRVNDLAAGIAFLVGGVALAQFAGSAYVTVPVLPLPQIDLALMFGWSVSRGTLQVSVLLPAVVMLALMLAWFLRYTRIGLLITAAGCPGGVKSLRVIGVNPATVRLLSTTVGGACGGIGGATLVMFYPGGWSDHLATGAGITAVTLVFIVRTRPILALLVTFVFAALAALGLALQATWGTGNYHLLNALPFILPWEC